MADPREPRDILGSVYLNGQVIGHYRWLQLETEDGRHYLEAGSDSAAAEALIAGTAESKERENGG